MKTPIKFLVYTLLLGLIISTNSCGRKKFNEVMPSYSTSSNDVDITHMSVASNFNYATVGEINLTVSAILDNGQPVSGAVFEVFDTNPQDNPNAIVLTKGVIGYSGRYNESITLASCIKSVFVKSNYIGLIDLVEADVIGNSISVDLNPSKAKANSGNERYSFARTDAAQSVNYTFLGTWNNLGVPNYLIANNDLVDASFLADVNAALPEQSQLPNKNPEYISQSTETDLILNDSADVWITFVHEGAGWKNSLGFYTYDKNNPPTSKSQITNHTIIFPNTSYQGSGGGLISGNKVKIGTFSKNTGIGWFLVANGWNGSTVGAGSYIQYSNPDFNLETVASLRPHMVLLNSVQRNRVLIGFEDMGRQSGADNDFNDALFYVTANPYTSIQFTNVVALPSSQPNNDIDGDGVYNTFDLYPNDPTKAYNSSFPATNIFGSLCFEDLWPSKGDFDFNDMVINYNFTQVLNATNDVVSIKAKFLVKAIGASFRNGFGIELPIQSSQVASVTGQRFFGNLVTLAGNNTEAGQNKATIIIFDNPEPLIQRSGGQYFNTESNSSKGASDSIIVDIIFTSPINTNQLGAIPFNPFIIINQDRGAEVHLPDFAPTSLANPSLIGQVDDNSVPATGRYYKTSSNLPFAINIPANFEYPTEKSAITNAHLKFKTWAESFGSSFSDWYKNLGGYRNSSNVYTK